MLTILFLKELAWTLSIFIILDLNL